MATSSFSVLIAKLTLFLLAANCLHLATSARPTLSFDYCDDEDDYTVKVEGVELKPNPVIFGEPVTITISASTAEEAISGGEVLLEFDWAGIVYASETRDLCEYTSCPIAAGDFQISHSQLLPKFSATRRIGLKITLKDSEKQQLTCFRFHIDIRFRALDAADLLSSGSMANLE